MPGYNIYVRFIAGYLHTTPTPTVHVVHLEQDGGVPFAAVFFYNRHRMDAQGGPVGVVAMNGFVRYPRPLAAGAANHADHLPIVASALSVHPDGRGSSKVGVSN